MALEMWENMSIVKRDSSSFLNCSIIQNYKVVVSLSLPDLSPYPTSTRVVHEVVWVIKINQWFTVPKELTILEAKRTEEIPTSHGKRHYDEGQLLSLPAGPSQDMRMAMNCVLLSTSAFRSLLENGTLLFSTKNSDVSLNSLFLETLNITFLTKLCLANCQLYFVILC